MKREEDEEEKTKLKWREKLTVKKFIKKLEKIYYTLEKRKKEQELSIRNRERIIETINQMKEVFVITDDKTGKEITKKELRTLEDEELITYLKEIIIKLEEIT